MAETLTAAGQFTLGWLLVDFLGVAVVLACRSTFGARRT